LGLIRQRAREAGGILYVGSYKHLASREQIADRFPFPALAAMSVWQLPERFLDSGRDQRRLGSRR
jgi:hypothetical protein